MPWVALAAMLACLGLAAANAQGAMSRGRVEARLHTSAQTIMSVGRSVHRRASYRAGCRVVESKARRKRDHRRVVRRAAHRHSCGIAKPTRGSDAARRSAGSRPRTARSLSSTSPSSIDPSVDESIDGALGTDGPLSALSEPAAGSDWALTETTTSEGAAPSSESGIASGEATGATGSTTESSSQEAFQEADGATEGGSPEATSTQSPAPFRFFAVSSFWNTALPADAPLDPASAGAVAALAQEVAKELTANIGPWINTTKFSVPVYTVPANQPTVAVQLVNHAPEPALSSAWSAVPLPETARPAKGSDGTLALWQPSTDRLWEFHRLVNESGVWRASWGGAMQNVSSNQGVFGPSAWQGAKPWWGASASSLSLVGGLISLEDLQLGQINHALDMAIPNVRGGAYSLPAQRDDGKSIDPFALPEGAHLRLNPNLNLASLHLPPLTLMLARAAQRYGIMVSDWSSVVEFYAQDPTPTGTEPYKGSQGYFEGKYPNQLLASFPWSQLELLKLELHKG